MCCVFQARVQVLPLQNQQKWEQSAGRHLLKKFRRNWQSRMFDSTTDDSTLLRAIKWEEDTQFKKRRMNSVQ
jgi:hypothetical protein